MKRVKEIKTNTGNNESSIRSGVYLLDSGDYQWITYTKSGVCKKLSTAMKKAGL